MRIDFAKPELAVHCGHSALSSFSRRSKLLSLTGFLLVTNTTLLVATASDVPAIVLTQVGSQKEQELKADIEKLIAGLIGFDEVEREVGVKVLSQIGPPALDQLRAIEDKGSRETKERVKSLIRSISATHSIPIKVNGAEFSVTTEANLWILPEAGKKTPVKFGLRMKNTTKAVFRFRLLGSVKLKFVDAKGKDVMTFSGVDHITRAEHDSPLLGEGQTIDMPMRGERLLWSRNQVSLVCEDPFGKTWGAPVSNGTYQLSIIYENTKEAHNELEPYWLGKAETIPETIHIK